MATSQNEDKQLNRQQRKELERRRANAPANCSGMGHSKQGVLSLQNP
jgi:hypothetical protein